MQGRRSLSALKGTGSLYVWGLGSLFACHQASGPLTAHCFTGQHAATWPERAGSFYCTVSYFWQRSAVPLCFWNWKCTHYVLRLSLWIAIDDHSWSVMSCKGGTVYQLSVLVKSTRVWWMSVFFGFFFKFLIIKSICYVTPSCIGKCHVLYSKVYIIISTAELYSVI